MLNVMINGYDFYQEFKLKIMGTPDACTLCPGTNKQHD